MTHVGRIYHQAKWLFKKQRKAALGKTRQAFKTHHGANHADYAHIYADSSLEQHIKAIRAFSIWCAQKRDIWFLKDINHELVGEYCTQLQHEGYSIWTIKARITAINHAMVGGGYWREKDAFTAKTWNETHYDYFNDELHQKNREEIRNNRTISAQTWRNEHEHLYHEYQQEIDTVRAFGLRRSELIHVDPRKPSIMANSFYTDERNHLYVFVPYGKGGRPRFAKCRNDLHAEMNQYYQAQPIGKLPQSLDDLKAFRDQWLSTNDENMRKQAYLFSKQDYHHAISYHRQRQEYAQVRLTEEQQVPPLKHDYQQTIEGVTAYHSQFERVSRDLGHNRVDVLGNYLANN